MSSKRKKLMMLVAMWIVVSWFALAQEKKEDPLDNFDGSKEKLIEIDPDQKENETEEDSGTGKISLGELSKDKIKQEKLEDSLENSLETENAKGNEVDELIKSSLEKMQPALSASGLALNQAEVFPSDI